MHMGMKKNITENEIPNQKKEHRNQKTQKQIENEMPNKSMWM